MLDADQQAAHSEAGESDKEPQVSLRTTGKCEGKNKTAVIRKAQIKGMEGKGIGAG